jgi:hypothetical protein
VGSLGAAAVYLDRTLQTDGRTSADHRCDAGRNTRGGPAAAGVSRVGYFPVGGQTKDPAASGGGASRRTQSAGAGAGAGVGAGPP